MIMKYYYDTQARCPISEKELLDEFIFSNADDYDNLSDCIERWIKNGNLIYIGHKDKYEDELRDYILKGYWWYEHWKAKRTRDISFADVVNATVEYVFNSEFNPYIEKPYLDVSWCKGADGVWLNLDDIWDVFSE